MRDSPVVSVVTPTLNQASFLARTLQSVCAQTYPAIEHIVIDGGSTDGTLEILRQQGDAGAIRWVTEADAGMYEAINKGLVMATGDILAYLNSDDAYLPWAVDAVMRVFRARPDVDLVYGDGIKVDESTGAQRLRLFGPFDRVSLANYESLMQPAVFWRRRLFERIGGFDARMRYVADLDYWLRAAAEGAAIAHLNEVIAIERIHPSRLSSARQEAMAAEDRAMRARHAGADGGPAGRKRAVDREVRWQRWLWLRFLTTYALRPLLSPWRNFLRDGEVNVEPRRVIDGTRRRHFRLLWNAVVSLRAAEVLGAEGQERARRRGAMALLIRLRLLGLALPRMLKSGYRVLTERGTTPASARPQAAK